MKPTEKLPTPQAVCYTCGGELFNGASGMICGECGALYATGRFRAYPGTVYSYRPS